MDKKCILEKCGKCEGIVELIEKRISWIQEKELLFNEDSFGYKCSLCGFSKIYISEDAAIRKKCFSDEFKKEIKEKYPKISNEAMTLFLNMIEYMSPKNYFCVNNQDEFLRISDICRISNKSEKEVDYLVEELWSKRLMVLVKFNDVKRYVVNAYELGLVDYEEFMKMQGIVCCFFRKDKKGGVSAKKRLRRLENLPNTFTEEQRVALLNRFGGKCAFTGQELNLHIDHVLPVASGFGGTTLENMLPIGQRLNSSKGDRNVFEWYEKNGERFEVVPELFTEAITYIAELNEMTYEEYREYVYACHNAKSTQKEDI